jgi:hypothetical protein
MRWHHLIALVLTFGSAFLGGAMGMETDTDRPGGNLRRTLVDDASACERECGRDSQCSAWTYVKRDSFCVLKALIPQPRHDACCTSGVRSPVDRPPPVTARDRATPMTPGGTQINRDDANFGYRRRPPARSFQ